MALTSVKVQDDFATWQAPGRSKPIVYSATLLNELSRQASRAYESFPNGGSEIGGVLFGSVDEDEIRITAARDVACEYRYGPCFVLSPSDEETLQKVIGEASSDPDLRGLIPVGWYHTHTRSPISMTPEDARIWNRYFPHQWQVSLILRPQRDEPTRGGFFFRPETGPVRLESSYKVFETETQHLPAPAIHKLAMAVRNPPPPAAAPEPVEEEAPDEMLWRPPSPSRWRRVLIPVAALVAVALGAGWIYNRVGPGGKPRPSLTLKLVDRGGQLRAIWDPTSPAILHAERGSIEIQNGNDKTRLPLHPELLRTGSLPILRPQGDVEVTLEVEAPELDTREGPIREVARYLAGEASGPRGGKDVGALREELARLQGDLANQSATNSEIESRIQSLKKQPQTPTPAVPPPAPVAQAKPEPPKPEPPKPAADPKVEAARLQAEIAKLRRQEQERLLARETAAAKDRAAKAEQERIARERIAQEQKQQAQRQLEQKQQELAASRAPAPPPAPVPAPVEQTPAPAPVVATPPPAPVEPAAPVYTGPRRGRLIWTGYLAPNGSLTINGRSASTGSVNGALPGVPVRVSAFPAEFSRGGLSVFSANQQLAQQEVVEGRSAQNGWMNTRYQYDPAKARSVQVTVPPAVGSGHRQVQLRGGDQAVSVVVIDWEVVR